SRRRHTRFSRDWSSDVCSSDLQDERVRFLILHYTALDNYKSLDVLTHQEVSAHYLVPDDFTDSIYVLVDETKRAWHAGASYWKEIGRASCREREWSAGVGDSWR